MIPKHVVLFWLRRSLREKESSTTGVSHAQMAAAGYSYEERRKIIDEAEKNAKEKQSEISSLRQAIEWVERLVLEKEELT